MCHASIIGAGNRPSIFDLFMPEAWMLGVEEIMDGNFGSVIDISKVSPTMDLFSCLTHQTMEAMLILFRNSNVAVHTLSG